MLGSEWKCSSVIHGRTGTVVKAIVIVMLFSIFMEMQGCHGDKSPEPSPSLVVDFYLYNGCGKFDSTSIQPALIEMTENGGGIGMEARAVGTRFDTPWDLNR